MGRSCLPTPIWIVLGAPEMETMRIVEANPFFYPFQGGIEHRMHMTSKLFAKRGHDVTILTSRLPGTKEVEETEYGYRIVRVPSRFINIYNPPYVISKNVLETLNGLDADIVNYNYRWAPSFDKDISHYEGKKVFTYHNMWGEGVGLTGMVSEINDNHYRKRLMRYDHIVAITDCVRDDLVRRGVPEDMITVISNCLETFPELSDEEGEFILNLGRMVSTKGLNYLVEAMRDVDYKLIMCGKGPESKKISKLIRKYGLEDRIEMKGWVTEEEKLRLMSTCKFFVMPSIYEAYGLAALEALSYGKPIVCTDVDGLPGNVKNAGSYVKPKDSKGLAKAINDLLENDDERKRLSDNALRVVHEFTWDDQIAKTEKLYRSIVDGDDN